MKVNVQNIQGGGMSLNAVRSIVNNSKEKVSPRTPLPKEKDAVKEEPIIWDCTKMQLIKFRDKLSANPSFARCFDPYYNLNIAIKSEAIQKTKGSIEDHFVCEVIGKQGLGKSRFIQCFVREINPKISVEHIGFTTESLLSKAEKIQKNMFLIKDENTLNVGEGSEREKLEQQNLIEVTRKHGLSLAFLSPSPRNLASVHYVFEVIQRCKQLRLTRVAVKEGNSYIGYITVYIPPDDKDKLYQDYLPFKNEFIEKTLKRNVGRLDYEKKAKEIMSHPHAKMCLKLADLETLSMEINPTLTTSEAKRIARKVLFLRMSKRQKPDYEKIFEEHKKKDYEMLGLDGNKK